MYLSSKIVNDDFFSLERFDFSEVSFSDLLSYTLHVDHEDDFFIT